jgi:hypothetical protein
VNLSFRQAALAIATALAAVSLAAPGAANAFEPRVPDDFYGISASEVFRLSKQGDDAAVDRHLDAIAGLGVDWVRSNVQWSDIEPLVPVGDLHLYLWADMDEYVAELAQRGLTLMPMPRGAPLWAADLDSTLAGCGDRSAVEPAQAGNYGHFVAQLVARYGRGGSFWSSHAQLPYRPLTTVELWNEPNWGAYWCPSPDPEAYARLAAAGADGVHSADPQAKAMIGGLATLKQNKYVNGRLHGLELGNFLERMTAAAPGLAQQVDAVGIHVYDADPEVNLSLFGWARSKLAAAGLGDAELMATEFGWAGGGDGGITEEVRTENYEYLLNRLPRTDCGVAGVAPHSWFSEEQDPHDPEQWWGIADRHTAALYPPAIVYDDQIALFTGNGSTPAPRSTITVCGQPEPPDQDGDGVPDSEDDYPTDPTRWEGSDDPPPPPPPDELPPEPRLRPALVADDFFGVSTPEIPTDPEIRHRYYDSMEDARIGADRDYIFWGHIEPMAPTDPAYAPEWSRIDVRMLGLANRGIRMVPAFRSRPAWLPVVPAQANGQYARFMGEFASRYGPGGSFWDENGQLDDELAPRDLDVWSDVNLDAAAWDGSASATEYAATYEVTRAAIRATNPAARAIVSLAQAGEAGHADEFIRDMVIARPSLAGAIDGVNLRVLDAASVTEVETEVRQLRDALDETGNAQAPIRVGFGWHAGSTGGLTEAQRTTLYADAASRLARGDCGVSGVDAYAWTTVEASAGNPWDWFGIAGFADGVLKPSGLAYRDTISSFLGYGSTPAPREALHPCSREAPDSDGDGVPDPIDDYPLDPTRGESTQQPPPAPQLDAKPDQLTRVTWATLRYSAAGATGYQCRLDTEAFHACVSTGTDYFPLADGQHTFRVRASDSLGLVGPQTSYAWTVDTRAPETSIQGPATVIGDSANFELQSDEPGSSFYCQYGSQPWSPCPASLTLENLTPGSEQLQAVAFDAAGNQDGSAATHSFEVQAAPDPDPFPDPDPDPDPKPDPDPDAGPGATVPTVQILKPPPRRTPDRTPTTRFVISGQPGAVAECAIDGGGWARCSSPYTTKRLKRGRHVIGVRARAGAASSAVQTARFRVVKRKH